MWFRSIRFRILAAFLVGMGALLVAMGVLVIRYGEVSQRQGLITDGYLPLAQNVDALQVYKGRVDNDLERLIRQTRRPGTGAASSARIYTEALQTRLDEARLVAQHAQAMAQDGLDQAVLNKAIIQLDRVDERFVDYQESSQSLMERLERTQTPVDTTDLKPLQQDATALGEDIDALSRQLQSRIRTLALQTDSMRRNANAVAASLAVLALATFVGGVMAVWLAMRPIKAVTDQVQRLAAGDYSGRVRVQGGDELAVLADEFNTMVEALQLRDRKLERLARSERLALIGQMLAQITHEVRNPLNALSLNTELLTDELGQLDPEKSTEVWPLISTISGEIERLTQVTAHYLQLARRPPAKLAQVDLDTLTQDVTRLLQVELDQEGVVLNSEGAADQMILADGNQLRQALINIVRNAVEAGATTLHLRLTGGEGQMQLSLADNGPGMTPEEIHRATDPFFSTKASGTGLGLAITRQIMEDHGGQLDIQSQVGKGSTVTMVLPIHNTSDPDTDTP